MDAPFCPLPDLFVLPSALPVPGGNNLPVQAFVLRGAQTIVVDAGLECEAGAVLEALDTVVDPRDVRWLVLTHEDADHTGALAGVLERAPYCRVIVTPTGAGKLASTGVCPPERLHVVGHGAALSLGGHRFRVLAPPMYDSPATLMLWEADRGWLFSSDAYGAFVPSLPEQAEAIGIDDLVEGMTTFCGLNSPWLADVDPRSFEHRLAEIRSLRPDWVFAAHLPPMRGPLFAALNEAATALPVRAAGLREQAA